MTEPYRTVKEECEFRRGLTIGLLISALMWGLVTFALCAIT